MDLKRLHEILNSYFSGDIVNCQLHGGEITLAIGNRAVTFNADGEVLVTATTINTPIYDAASGVFSQRSKTDDATVLQHKTPWVAQ